LAVHLAADFVVVVDELRHESGLADDGVGGGVAAVQEVRNVLDQGEIEPVLPVEEPEISRKDEKRFEKLKEERLCLQFEIYNGPTYNIFRQKGRFFENMDQNEHENIFFIGLMTFKILILTDFHVLKTIFQTITCTKTS